MKPLWIASALLALTAFASAQSLPEYLRVRKQYGIDRAVGIDAVQSVQDSKVFEIQGIVKGSSKSNHRFSLLVGSGGGDFEVDADAAPDWLLGDEVAARLLVRAIRDGDSAPVRIKLIGAAKEEEIAKIDAAADAARRKRAADAKAAAARAAAAKLADEPARDGRDGLFGPIGRHSEGVRTGGEWVVPKREADLRYAAYIKQINPHLRDAEALQIARNVIDYCLSYGVEPRLVMAVVVVESGFDPNSVSHSGAVGLGQLMPGTARWMGVSDPYDIVQNIYGMVKLLRTHIEQYSAPGRSEEQVYSLALAAYNAGEGAVRRHGGVPPYAETQAYIRHVLSLYYRLGGQ